MMNYYHWSHTGVTLTDGTVWFTESSYFELLRVDTNLSLLINIPEPCVSASTEYQSDTSPLKVYIHF